MNNSNQYLFHRPCRLLDLVIYLLVGFIFLFPMIRVKASCPFIIDIALTTFTQETKNDGVFCVMLKFLSSIKKEK